VLVHTDQMSMIAEWLEGKQIHSVWVDSELTYIMLTNGTQITVRGLLEVAPGDASSNASELSNHSAESAPQTSEQRAHAQGGEKPFSAFLPAAIAAASVSFFLALISSDRSSRARVDRDR
jgi:hypothetical protein